MAIVTNTAFLPGILRETIQTEIEHLINVLDFLDSDADLEDNGDDEPDPDGEYSLGWTDREAAKGNPHCEHEDREVDTADDEPLLGAPEPLAHVSQAYWAEGGYEDLEEECEDEGAQCDDEGVVDADMEGWCHPEVSTMQIGFANLGGQHG